MAERAATLSFIYDIIGHNTPEDQPAPDGIEEYTRELVQLRLDIEDFERKINDLSVQPYGINSEEDTTTQTSAIWHLMKNLGTGPVQHDEITNLEEEYQSVHDRIADVRYAMITGHVSRVDAIDSSEINSRLSKRKMTKWVRDGTFPNQIEKIESAADRADRRLTAKRETVNAKTSLTVSTMTVLVSVLLLVFASLTFIVSLLSTIQAVF